MARRFKETVACCFINMKNIYQDDEFEQFLQDSVKQHRVYPSDHIWKNIRTQIHGYRAWPALTFISLFIITALTLSTLLNNHPDAHLSASALAALQQANGGSTSATGPVMTPAEKNKQYFQQTAPEHMTAQTFADVQPENITGAENELPVIITPMRDVSATPIRAVASSEKATRREVTQVPQEDRSVITLSPSLNFTDATASLVTAPEEIIKEAAAIPVRIETKKADIHSSADDFLKDFNFIANVPARSKNSKFGFQFYATPSTSYRRLSDQKAKEIIQPAINSTQGTPLNTSSTADVNQVVRHRPAMGLELGFGLLYNMTNKLKFKTGLQLNVRQYYIETFQSSTNDLTSLLLINYRGVDTVNFYSQYNNNTGYKKTQLDNKIYQISVPLGVQWDVFQGKHLGMNAEASVQPTLTLNTNTYMLSSDYKHYADGSNLVRKWNINTSVGFNITYKSGTLMYTVGPQLRYQHLPTYSNLYPIKEYLMDYGIRFGVTKQLFK